MTPISRKIWNAVSGDETNSLIHKHIVRSIDISKDSSRLLTASKNSLYLYDFNKLEAGELPVLSFHDFRSLIACTFISEPSEIVGHENAVKRVIFTPDSRFILSAAEDMSVRLRETTHSLTAHNHN